MIYGSRIERYDKTKLMSRSYDALKKVEGERSPYKVIGIEEVETPVAATVAKQGVAEAGLSPTSHPIALEALLERCPPLAWAPNTETMLFFSSGEKGRRATEEFRTLRSRLHQVREKHPLQKVLVTSAVPKEGRSFVAANLAQVLAIEPGCRTLLIDADLRDPSLHSSLGTFTTPGLSEYVRGESDELEIIQRGMIENLFLVASGRKNSAPPEVISSRLKVLLGCLEPLFDWIVIDAPPALHTADSSLIANLCDGILMVVRSNSTPFDYVRKARQKFPDNRLIGVVLNEIPPEI